MISSESDQKANAIYGRECSFSLLLSLLSQEAIKDLLISGGGASSRPAATIRENPGGGVSLYGAVEKVGRCASYIPLVYEYIVRLR